MKKDKNSSQRTKPLGPYSFQSQYSQALKKKNFNRNKILFGCHLKLNPIQRKQLLLE